jgi:uncharacterized phage infection (PIP) family protein YhgE
MNKFLESVLGSKGTSSSPAQPNQPQPDFYYSDDINTIPVSLQQTFNNLKKAINNKKNILEQYKGLYARLQSMDGLLDTYITNHATANQKLSELTTEKEALELERDNLKTQSTPEDLRKITELNQEIAGKQDEINQLNQQQSLNVNNMTAINKLLDEATSYINNMYPTNNSEITDIKRLIDQMKIKLGSVPVVVEPDVDLGEIHNPYRKIGNDNIKGGYRYSSSQIRRKSSARRSSSSRSSSSQRRRNKKRTARKKMLGGKRMKKTKSKFTKRKHHKKH